MANFLLIHGSAHGAWCWRDVLPCLAAMGHRATAIDLPAHGANRSATDDLASITLDLYAQTIVQALHEPSILVGHSMAGYPITAAAERDPALILALVYLCAYVPQSGQSLAQMRRAGPSQPLADAFDVAPDRRSFTFHPDKIAQKFYHDCPAEAVSYARANLCPEPIAPQETALHLTPHSQSLPRHYIRCTDDRAIPPEYQETMARGLLETTLPTSHSPFFAAPLALAARLDLIAKSL